MDEIVIVSGCRTPVGKFQGSLSDISATKLGAVAVREAVKRAQLTPEQIDECIMGNVVSAGLGQNPARQAALFGGLPPEVSAVTVNMVCGSGLRAVSLAAQTIQTGNAEIIVAGGMESMTNAPYLLPQARSGFRMGNSVAVDSMVNDGLWDVYNDFHMGQTAELVAEKYGIPREDQDAFAVASHQKAAAAWREGRFAEEVVPVELPAKKKGAEPRLFERDEAIGGLVRFGVPDFKIEKTVVQRRVEQLVAEGVEIRCGVDVGSDSFLATSAVTAVYVQL